MYCSVHSISEDQGANLKNPNDPDKLNHSNEVESADSGAGSHGHANRNQSNNQGHRHRYGQGRRDTRRDREKSNQDVSNGGGMLGSPEHGHSRQLPLLPFNQFHSRHEGSYLHSSNASMNPSSHHAYLAQGTAPLYSGSVTSHARSHPHIKRMSRGGNPKKQSYYRNNDRDSERGRDRDRNRGKNGVGIGPLSAARGGTGTGATVPMNNRDSAPGYDAAFSTILPQPQLPSGVCRRIFLFIISIICQSSGLILLNLFDIL